jgi:hypothetical protein
VPGRSASCELFSVVLAKLIFNFLSLIRHGSSYGSLGLYTPAPGRGFIGLVAGLTRCSIVSCGCIILPLETPYFLPCSVSLFPGQPVPAFDPLIAPASRAYAARTPVTRNCRACRQTRRINNRETNNPETVAVTNVALPGLCRQHSMKLLVRASRASANAATRRAGAAGFNYGK